MKTIRALILPLLLLAGTAHASGDACKEFDELLSGAGKGFPGMTFL